MDFTVLRALLDASIAPETTRSPPNNTTQQSSQSDTIGTLDTASTKSIALHLETITKALITGLNHRLFSIENIDLHSFIDPDFSAAPNHPWDGQPVDFRGYLAYVRSVVATYPAYWVKIVDLSTIIDDRTRTAKVFMNFEVSGTASDVVRQSVGVLHFRYVDGKWLWFSYEGIDGMEGTESAKSAGGEA